MTRRMFSDEITKTDSFLDMPKGSQLLYFHLGMEADDDGFISSPRMVMRVIGASDDELKILFAKKFLLEFESGICVIKHWRLNNQLRKDRYNETRYTKEKSLLFIRENGAYTFNPEGAERVPKGHFLPSGNQLATERQPSIGKDSIEEDSIEDSNLATKRTYGEFKKVKLTDSEYQKLVDKIGENNTQVMIDELDTYVASKGKKYSSHYATILSWTRKRVLDHTSKSTKVVKL